MKLVNCFSRSTNSTFTRYRQALILSRGEILQSSNHSDIISKISPATLYLLTASDFLYSNVSVILQAFESLTVKKQPKHLMQSANNSTRALLDLCLHFESSSHQFKLSGFDTFTSNDLLLALNALSFSLLDSYPYNHSGEAILDTALPANTFTESIPLFTYRQADILHRCNIMLTKSNQANYTLDEIALFYYLAGNDHLYCNASRIYDFRYSRLKAGVSSNPNLNYLNYGRTDLFGFADFLLSSHTPFKKETGILRNYQAELAVTINALLIRYYDQVKIYFCGRHHHGKRS
jgi:hypothetical protein